MIALVLVRAAAAAPTAPEQFLEWYAAGEREKLWEAATDHYRDDICRGRVEHCPDLGRVPLGTPVSRREDCRRERCTFVRTDRYDTPPLPGSDATELDWIVTTAQGGRFEGVAVDFEEPGAGLRTVAAFLGVLCGIGATWFAVAGALAVLLRAGAR